MDELASVGDFCPNPACEHYGVTQAENIIRYGKTKDGRQRFQCKTCRQTFNERKGTLFYNRKTDEKDILECLALLAEGIKADTILSFLRQAADHAEQVEAILLNDYRISQVQLDGLWTYVGRKKVPTNRQRMRKPGNTGVVQP